MNLKHLLSSAFIILLHVHATAQDIIPSRQDTLKGSITPGREWWDLIYYALSVTPDYETKTIRGRNSISFEVIRSNKNRFMQIDLQKPLVIDSAIYKSRRLEISREGDAWFVKMPDLTIRSLNTVDIYYSGKPKESLNPPWDGGVSWKKDSLERPWITLGAQLVGASVWFPCKVHQGDEPDKGASISITVPDTLVGVGNGRLKEITKNNNGTRTFSWQVIKPINNYGLAFYVGKYVNVHEVYPGEKKKLDTDYWVIDYNRGKVHSYLKHEVNKTLKAFEYWFGPYPFYEDSFKMVEAPYPGMEHQSAIAYGNGFRLGRIKLKNLSYWDLKTDRLVVHEMAHEWFGNSITTKDFTDRWVHEGFAGFAEELFIEEQYGKQAAKEFFEARTLNKIDNNEPLIRRYGIFEDAGGHMYLKGWTLIHTLRALLDDDKRFRRVLRGLNKEFYHRTVESAEVEKYISKAFKMDLQPIFDQYLREKDPPTFEYRLQGQMLSFRYRDVVPGFNMPIKTNLTGNRWLRPGKEWQEISVETETTEELKIGSDFYVNIEKTLL